MQIKFYVLSLFTFISINCSAQELFSKKELYHVWIVAEEKLDAGLFDDALKLYNTHAENPSFNIKIRQITRLKEISADGERLRKKGRYAEAVSKYTEYRKLKDVGTLGIFEKKIEQCLTQINSGRLSELTNQQRIITGFEFAHRGREKLSKLDTTGAKRDFNNAKNLGGNLNNILKEQYTEGTRITTALTKWGQIKVNTSGQSKAEELSYLETYREIRNVDIPAIELKIKELRNEIDGHNSLLEIAKLCDTELLLTYVSNHKNSISASGFLINRINEFRSTQNKISLLKQNSINSATVESAYSSLFSWIEDFPQEIQNELTNCIKNDYQEYKKNQIATKQNPVECRGINDFNKGISLIRRALSDCNTSRAKSLWNTNLTFIRDCNNSEAILYNVQTLKDSVFLFAKNDSILLVFRSQLQTLLQKGDCSEATKVYEQMKQLEVCDQNNLNEEVKTGLSQTANCENKSWWKPELTGSAATNIPKYKIGDTSRKMGNGSTISAGAQYSFIDHKNPVDFMIGLEYFKTDYYSEDVQGSLLEDFSMSGANVVLVIKFHKPNTDPNHIRPYLKLGSEILIPVSYNYENYSTLVKVDNTDQIQKTILSVTGAIGMEIQKKHFGAFIEGFSNYALGNIYNSEVSHLTSTNQKIDAKLIKLGIRIGLRLW